MPDPCLFALATPVRAASRLTRLCFPQRKGANRFYPPHGHAKGRNGSDYRLLGLKDVPVAFETHVLPPPSPWGDTPTGMGEMGLPSLAPALTNAIFAACGVRVRALPIGGQLEQALSA